MSLIADRIPVIDTDTHVIEPPDLWTSRMSAKWGDRRPHVAYHKEWGLERWRIGDRWLNAVGVFAAAGWKNHPPSHPPTLAEADPGGFDPAARLQRMDEYGLHAQVLYPNVIAFDSQVLIGLNEPELALDCVRAYNDFLTDFSSVDPARLLPVCMLPFWDVDASVKEMRRCAANGHRGALWAAKLQTFGLPRIIAPHWDPVYATAQELDLSLNLHVGVGAALGQDNTVNEAHHGQFRISAYVVESSISFLSNMHTIGTLLVSDLFERFPKLQVVSVESGWGYLPYLLESLDWQWKNSSGPMTYPNRRLPSEKFFTNVYGTFWFERETLSILRTMPQFADRLMFETDYPHPTSLSPGPASTADNPKIMIEATLSDMTEDVVRKLLHDNAANVYHLD